MDHRIFRTPLLGFVFRHSGAIPIAPAKEDPALLGTAFATAAAALANGELVGLFPEGGDHPRRRTPALPPGISRILEAHPVPVVPLALRGLWGSIFFADGRRGDETPFRAGLLAHRTARRRPVPPGEADARASGTEGARPARRLSLTAARAGARPI